MPADHCLRLNDYESAPPARPKTGEDDPEHAIQSREPRPWMPLGADSELLTERELDDGLVPAISEERQDAAENRDRERCYGPHRASNLDGIDDAKRD